MTCFSTFSFHGIVSPKKAVFEGDRFLKLGGGRFRSLRLCVRLKLFKKTSRFGWAVVEGVGAAGQLWNWEGPITTQPFNISQDELSH